MDTLSPIRLPNISDVVYEILRRKIIQHEFLPGHQLNLRELEELLEVSRTPLKAALARLQVEGFIQVHPRRGTYVTEFTRRDVEECFEVRIAIEAQALRRAFEPSNRERYDQILRLFDLMAPYFQNPDTLQAEVTEYMDYDRELHVQIVQLSHNDRFKQIYEQANVQGFIALMGNRFYFDDVQHTQREHRALAAAFRSGDLSDLLIAGRAHLEGAMQRAMVRLFEQGR